MTDTGSTPYRPTADSSLQPRHKHFNRLSGETSDGDEVQGFGGQELYPNAEEKASNLLYLIIKDHPLANGNQRSAAALLVTFLSKNGMLHRGKERALLKNSALAAITLMVAMSEPQEKNLMTTLVMNMLSDAPSES